MTTQQIVTEQQEFLRRNSTLVAAADAANTVSNGTGEGASSADRLSDMLSDKEPAVVIETTANLSGSLSDNTANLSDSMSDSTAGITDDRNSSSSSNGSSSSGFEDAGVEFGSSHAPNEPRGNTAAAKDDPTVFAATLTSASPQEQQQRSGADSNGASNADSAPAHSAPADSARGGTSSDEMSTELVSVQKRAAGKHTPFSRADNEAFQS